MVIVRVIGGEARGLKLVSPPGRDTRPTADAVREALFNILSSDVIGARFLDLFTGTGAVGIEAVSRGAEEAVLVDNSRRCADCARKNAERTKLGDRLTVYAMEASEALRFFKKSGLVFDVIYIDPPYGKGLILPALAGISQNGLLTDGGIIAAERGGPDLDADMEACVRGAGFGIYKSRRYGGTVLDFIRQI